MTLPPADIALHLLEENLRWIAQQTWFDTSEYLHAVAVEIFITPLIWPLDQSHLAVLLDSAGLDRDTEGHQAARTVIASTLTSTGWAPVIRQHDDRTPTPAPGEVWLEIPVSDLLHRRALRHQGLIL